MNAFLHFTAPLFHCIRMDIHPKTFWWTRVSYTTHRLLTQACIHCKLYVECSRRHWLDELVRLETRRRLSTSTCTRGPSHHTSGLQSVELWKWCVKIQVKIIRPTNSYFAAPFCTSCVADISVIHLSRPLNFAPNVSRQSADSVYIFYWSYDRSYFGWPGPADLHAVQVFGSKFRLADSHSCGVGLR